MPLDGAPCAGSDPPLCCELTLSAYVPPNGCGAWRSSRCAGGGGSSVAITPQAQARSASAPSVLSARMPKPVHVDTLPRITSSCDPFNAASGWTTFDTDVILAVCRRRGGATTESLSSTRQAGVQHGCRICFRACRLGRIDDRRADIPRGVVAHPSRAVQGPSEPNTISAGGKTCTGISSKRRRGCTRTPSSTTRRTSRSS